MIKKYVKTLTLFVAVCALALTGGTVLTGCGRNNTQPDIVVTVFPAYDWVMNILGDNPGDLSVKYLLSNGVDLHNYSPSVRDIASIKTAKLFIYVGGESDNWAANVLENANENIRTVRLMDYADDHDDHEHEDHEDEHVWLSPHNARHMTGPIRNAIREIDAANADVYNANTTSYNLQLRFLENAFMSVFNLEHSSRTIGDIVFADRFPFESLFTIEGDGEITVHAAFNSCSAEAEMPVGRPAELARVITDNNLKVILVISDTRLANTVKTTAEGLGATNLRIIKMYDGQSVSQKDINNGMTYLSFMTKNLEALIQALA